MTHIRLISALLVAATACGGASGEFHGDSGPVPDWKLEPDRCAQTGGTPTLATIGGRIAFGLGGVADLYYAGLHASDTEVVVRDTGDDRQVLVRIPGKDKMVVLRRTDCTVFDIGTGSTAYTLNDEQGLTGHVRLDCTRPEIGHVTGSATFTCF